MTDGTFSEEVVRLASADNFRDLAAYAEGRIAPGRFFRSNELTLTHEDAGALAALGVRDVYDLRDAHEIEAHPDADIPGARWHHVEVKGIPMEAVANLESSEQAVEVMHQVYRGFVDHPGGRAAFATLLSRLAASDGAQVYHCTAGKDRTGWASVLLLHLAGVPDELVLADYLATNDVSTATREKYLGLVAEHLGPDKVAVYDAVMVVDESYLRAAHAAVAASYGDLDGYVREGLGLGDDVVEGLRARLRPDGTA